MSPRPLLPALLLAAAVATLSAGDAAQAAPPFEGRYEFRDYGLEDGLSDLDVQCLLQDAQGFLWVGTGGGLFRWGGRRFTRYGREDGLPSNGVTALHELRDGRLFVGTQGGLARRDGDRFVALGEAHGLPESTIPYSGLASDTTSTLYVGTRRGLFVSRDGDAFRLVPRGDGRPETVAYGMHLAPSGALVFARANASLYRLENDGVTTDLGGPAGLSTAEWTDSTVTDRAGRLWVRTPKHLYVLAPGDARFREDDEALPAAFNSGRLALDDRGELLVPTIDGVAQKDWSRGRWALIGQAEGLPSGATTSALVDREGSLWVGLIGGGLARRIGRGSFTSWGRLQGLSYDRVTAVLRGSDGALWIGTEDGLDRIDPTTGAVRVWRESDGLASNDVRALATSPDGSVWVGAWTGGVSRLIPGTGKIRRYAFEGLDPAQVHVRAMLAARSGDVWVGTWNGVLYLPAGAERFVRVPLPREEDPDTIDGFAEDDAGTVWAATRWGLARITGGAPRRFGVESGLRAADVAGVVRAPDGTLYVSYGEPPVGVDRVEVQGDALAVRPLVTLPPTAHSTRVLGLDAGHGLWLATGAGVDVVDAGGTLRAHYGTGDGMPVEEVTMGLVADPDGAAWFGTSRGLVEFHPRVEPAPLSPPRVVLTEVEAGGHRLALDGRIALAPGDRSLRIAWAALTFVGAEKVRFRWRLLGSKDEGFATTTIDEVRFQSLPAGSYRFEVLATSAAGVESVEPAAVAFEVLPAWWEAWWARGCVALAALAIVASAVRLRTRALRADRRRLEEAVAARSRELAIANRELAELSFTDPLTKLKNRRYFETVIGEHVARSTGYYASGDRRGPAKNRDLVFYVVDFDRFKQINDAHGHDAGDRVLAELGRRLALAVRKTDLVVRWGGEEFVVVSTDTERSAAEILARRILGAVGAKPFEVGEDIALPCTCSIGWAPFPFFVDAPRALGHDDVLRLADRALYAAKRLGRARALGVLPRVAAADASVLDAEWSTRRIEPGEGDVLEVVESLGVEA